MDEPEGNSQSPGRISIPVNRSRVGGRALFALALAAMNALLVWQVMPGVLEGELVDPDAYMRLVRVTHLVETGDWFDSSIPRSNAPFGETLHWTRPLDVLLLLGSAPFLLFVPFSKALFLAGVLLSPVLLLFICYSAAWAAEPIAGRRVEYLAMIAILAQPGILQACMPGRPDHHSLHILVFILMTGAGIRWLTRAPSRLLAAGTGGLMAFGLWVGPEFLAPIACVFFVGLMVWVKEGGNSDRKNLWLSLGFLLVVLFAGVLEHPPHTLLTEEYDRLSLPHVFIGVLASGFWAIIAAFRDRPRLMGSWRRRLLVASLVGLAALGALWGTFPSFFLGPEARIDPELTPIWRAFVEEDQPLIGGMTLWDWGFLLSHIGAIVFCIPFLGWLVLKERGQPLWNAWIFLSALLALFSGLAIYRVRFVIYPSVLVVLVSVTLISRVLPRLDSIEKDLLRVGARVGFLASILTGPLFLGLGLRLGSGEEGQRTGEGGSSRCPLTQVTRFLSTQDSLTSIPGTVAAHIGYGPEILYRTRYKVLGTPYHRNAEGILALFSLLKSTEPEKEEQLASERDVGIVLICPQHAWIYSNEPDHQPDTTTLHNRLLNGDVPGWLERVPLPAETAGDMLLFRTRTE